ncbi:MAG TPA: flagellar basal body P-ring formation chaperone FlgA [Aquabacterium sp.]|nr:flagellar basal body P-ring formation chaperone FlgA [Aquabacterium sp.]HRH27854.1 flagellar basal body P-ring formation chaperone FlgA [Aquabacterium sp.]
MKPSLLVSHSAPPSAPPAVRRLAPVSLQRDQVMACVVVSILWVVVCVLLVWAMPAQAQSQDLQAEVSALLKAQTEQAQQLDGGADGADKPRIEVVLGQLDPRLKLAPCDKVRTYLPNGTRLWGKARVGMRCEQGPVRWNVYWPVTVKVWAPAVVAVTPIRAGSVIGPADLRLIETDLAASRSPAILRMGDVLGRSVLKNIEPGQALRQDDIRTRRWFAVGEPVRVTVKGSGFSASAEGMALSPGDEGQCAKIRFDSGRVVCGLPVGERQAEVSL